MSSIRVTTALLARGKPCGHERHVGTCSSCQCAQLARWREQLAQAQPSRPGRLGLSSPA